MGDLRKVKSGEPLEVSAETWNAFIDAANDFRRRQQNQGVAPTPTFRQTGIVPIKNASGADLGRFSVLGIDSPIFSPTDNEDNFKNRVALVGVTPSVETHAGRFAILLEPVADGKIGQAVVAGICVVKIDVADEGDGFADVSDGSSSSLASGSSGTATILWKESGTGEVWGIVLFGGGGSGTGDGGGGNGGGGDGNGRGPGGSMNYWGRIVSGGGPDYTVWPLTVNTSGTFDDFGESSFSATNVWETSVDTEPTVDVPAGAIVRVSEQADSEKTLHAFFFYAIHSVYR